MRKVFLPLAVALVGLILASPAAATTVSFGDNSIYWPGYWATNDAYGPDNTRDTIGSPEISGGQATVESGRLVSIGISGTGYADYNIIKPGDLFIDVGANQTWDYVVKMVETPFLFPFTGPYNVLKLTNPIPLSEKNPYLITGKDDTAPWGGFDIRNDHPYALNLAAIGYEIWGAAIFSGFNDNSLTTDLTTFTFLGKPVDVGGDPFILGWTENCANDVLYEQVQVSTPEPATLLLLGSGLVAFGGFSRKLKRS